MTPVKGRDPDVPPRPPKMKWVWVPKKKQEEGRRGVDGIINDRSHVPSHHDVTKGDKRFTLTDEKQWKLGTTPRGDLKGAEYVAYIKL